ncbi:MAG: Ni/Fe hydrogenase subunit alpha [Phycisphaerales bacterium]|nr:MAG: Ni/Fe hydrogenase subunit alpha [Phycisphaerales bacterium]
MKNVTISVKHITRVEGHGNISVRVEDGEITELQLAIVESPRFFESFLRGRHYSEAPHIACRICGICSVGHTTASVNAMEAALAIEPSEQTVKLRKLIMFGEEMQSHVLHVLFLAVPDFLGVGSVLPLARTHPDVVKIALRLKRLSNDICGAVGGRHIHPIACHVGGLTHVPRDEELIDLKRRCEAARSDIAVVAETYAQFKIPGLERDTEYVCLKASDNGEYAFCSGDIVSTKDPKPTNVADYRKRIIEEVVRHSAAKHARSPHSPSYAVGALARFNNNYDQLHLAAKEVAEGLGLRPVNCNPFHNNTAQVIELVHCLESAIELIDELLTRGLAVEPLRQPTRFGQGAGAADVPRGTLIHDYSVDAKGYISEANLIIPTNQNLANIEADMRAYVPKLLESGLSREEMTLQLEMLVRAYDPCISCATHFLDVKWE